MPTARERGSSHRDRRGPHKTTRTRRVQIDTLPEEPETPPRVRKKRSGTPYPLEYHDPPVDMRQARARDASPQQLRKLIRKIRKESPRTHKALSRDRRAHV